MTEFVFLFCLLFRWGVLHRVLVGWCQVLYSSGFLCVSSHYLIPTRVSSLVMESLGVSAPTPKDQSLISAMWYWANFLMLLNLSLISSKAQTENISYFFLGCSVVKALTKSPFGKNSNSVFFFMRYSAQQLMIVLAVALHNLVSLAGITSLRTGQAWVPRLDCCEAQHPRRMWQVVWPHNVPGVSFVLWRSPQSISHWTLDQGDRLENFISYLIPGWSLSKTLFSKAYHSIGLCHCFYFVISSP